MKRLLGRIIDVVLIIGVCVGFYFVGHYFFQHHQVVHEEQTTTKLAKKVVKMPKNGQITINWQKLHKTNPKIKAWIYIPGTHINEPILQGNDNAFYLSHDENDQESILGQIFMDYRNKANFADKNTFIYGHYTHSGQRFADLDEYLTPSFFRKHLQVYLYTPKEKFVGTVFAVESNSGLSRANTREFKNKQQFTSYINYLKRKSSVKSTLKTKNITKIATLWTCTEQATTGDQGETVSADKARTFVSVSLKKVTS